MTTETIHLYEVPEFHSADEFDSFLADVAAGKIPVYTTATLTTFDKPEVLRDSSPTLESRVLG